VYGSATTTPDDIASELVESFAVSPPVSDSSLRLSPLDSACHPASWYGAACEAIDVACEAVAVTLGLTDRELTILGLLAAHPEPVTNRITSAKR